MTTSIENTKGAADKIVLSIDAMGGDGGPAAVVAGVARAAKQNAHLYFIIHGKKSVLDLQVAKRRALWGRVDIRDTSDVVSMDDKPSQVLRSGKNTSMWSAI
ncbi:MAG: phosphate acyltransferase, partial [Marinovum sp.]|nr:phosphate acyltransferase [Marinovum sp.]